MTREREEDTQEPFYDPVHVGAAVVITLAALGALYWLLWTLLVFEGGIFLKLRALARLALGRTTLRGLGWEGWPYALGELEGVFGNFAALLLCAALAAALYRLYRKAARGRKP